jgi:DNA polymerase II small subunit/DNA polymerase delta subunit B
MRTFERDLPVRLTREELEARGQMLALKVDERAEIEVEAKAEAAEYKAQMGDTDKEIRRLSRIVRDKSEPRPVECFEHLNFAGNEVQIVRRDTGEVVDTRAMTDADRQRNLEEVANERATLSRFERPSDAS